MAFRWPRILGCFTDAGLHGFVKPRALCLEVNNMDIMAARWLV